MSVRRKLLLALSTATVVASALVFAAPSAAYASGENCNDNGSWDTCITVEGSGNYIDWVYGFSQSDSAFNGTYDLPFHVQLINPDGKSLCNSATVTNTGTTSQSCFWESEAYQLTGNYCLLTWVYEDGVYHDVSEECLNVFVD
jgi:hypothetical protein